MLVGTDVTNSAWDPTLTTKWPASRITRVFNTPSENLRPWSVVRYTSLPQTIAPHVSFKAWPDDATVVGWVTSFLDTMPSYLTASPLLPEIGGYSMALTWYHEPESDSAGGAGAAEYKRRYGVLYSTVKGHANGHLVAVVPIQTQYWTVIHNGGDPSTWWAGSDRADGCGMDCYDDMAGAAYQDADAFLTGAFALRDLTGLPLWVPELGSRLYSVDGSNNPLDTTGALRAAWITSVVGRLEKGLCVSANWWDSLATNGDMRLLDQPSIDAWARALANGGHDVARHAFGDTLPDYAFDSVTVSGTDNVVVLQPSAVVKFYTEQTGGALVDDLSTDINGLTAMTSVTTSDGSDLRKPGQIPQFYGPDTEPETLALYASANDGPRQLILSPDVAQVMATVAALNATLQSHMADYNNPHQVTVSDLADAAVAATPVTGDVLTFSGGKWTNLAPAQVAGAVVLNPPATGGTWHENLVDLTTGSGTTWSAQGGGGDPWLQINIPYSAADTNPDVLQMKSTLSGGALVRTGWWNGNGEPRAAPSLPARVASRVFEMWENASLGPSTQQFFQCSTNPTNTANREALFGVYGTAHSTKPGWGQFTRTVSALQGVSAGGNFNGLSAVLYAGRSTTAGPPTSGTFVTGTMIPDINGADWLCTAGGTPGTWVSASGFGAWTDIASLGTNVSLGTPHAQSRTAPGGMVELQGQLTMTGSISSGATLATLPSGQWPASPAIFTVRFSGTSAATALLTVSAAGVVTLQSSLVTGNTFNLDGLAFPHV